MKWRLAIIFCLSCCTLAQQGGIKLNPVTWTVYGPAEAVAGSRLKAKVTARIADGWHLYSLKKYEDGPIPTSIEIAEAQYFRVDGVIDAPAPLTQRDEQFGIDIEFYLSEATFTLPIVVSKQASPGPQQLIITARYQTCDNLQCLPPRTIRLEHSVVIKK
jgi:thiol:disulfide interchange protein DsbD